MDDPVVVEKILGDDSLAGVVLRNLRTEERREVRCASVFVAIGHDPKGSVFNELVKTDENGFIPIRPYSELPPDYVPDVVRELTTSLDVYSGGEGGGIHVAANAAGIRYPNALYGGG